VATARHKKAAGHLRAHGTGDGIEDAASLPPGTHVWVLTDGKAGDEEQCLGVAEALGVAAEVRRVAPRAPFAWLMPWGPIDPRDRARSEGSPIAPPFPDVAIASGRRAVPYLRALKRASRGRTLTVDLTDPRTGPRAADLIWAPTYDGVRGDNVVTTLTSPHRISARRLAEARAAPDRRLAALPRPRAAVLVGGDSRHSRWTADDVARFASHLEALAGSGVALMGTTSRRTAQADPTLKTRVEAIFEAHGGFLWDGTGDNPYVQLLACADAVVVTADSVNMVGEAAATGRPVLVFRPTWRTPQGPRSYALVAGLERDGVVHPFKGSLEGHAYEPLNSTSVIAGAVASAYARHRRALGLTAP
jgi:mitochondrial fission protein ELM1